LLLPVKEFRNDLIVIQDETILQEETTRKPGARESATGFERLEPVYVPQEQEQIHRNKNVQEFLELCLEDYRGRPKSRKIYGRLISGLLIAQNALLYSLIIFLSIWHAEDLQRLQWLFSVLVSGTLVETYFTFNHVIRWLFNEVDYKSFVYPHMRLDK
jgi:hypothetical protein